MADSVREIENLLYTYAERIDAGDFGGVAALFAHGRICGLEDTPETTFAGRDAVRQMYETTTRIYPDTGTPKTKHVVSNARIDVDDEAGAASARSSYTVMQATDALPLQVVITGRYHDTFRRIDGTWWFDTRIMLVDQLGDLSHHLLFDVPPA